MVRPNLRLIQPKPPPRVSPAMPVVELMPSGTREAVRLGRGVDVGERAPGSTRAVRGAGSTATARICERSSEQRAVGDGEAGDLVAAAADREDEAVVAGEVHRGLDVAASRRRGSTRPGRRSIIAFQSVRASS